MPARLGIVAGGGALPAVLAEACRRARRPCFVLALDSHADPERFAAAPPDAWAGIGDWAGAIAKLRAAGVEELVLAGSVRRPAWSEIRLDARAARLAARLALGRGGDDGLLSLIVAELEAEGFRVVAPEDVLADLTAGEGRLAGPEPGPEAMRDIARALEVLRALGPVDVGQAAVVQQGLVLGIEAAEGTDALIARSAALARPGPRPVLVKAAKPGQERRADLPTIGPETIAALKESGFCGVAIEAGRSLIVERAATLRRADAGRVFVLGVRQDA